MRNRRLAAVVVTDVVGFTALMGADQDKALQLLDCGHDLLKSIIAQHGGEWLDDAGDRSLSAFPSAINAVRCALEIRSRIQEETELSLRIGIDVGDIIVTRGHAYGDTINIASFIERLADPNGLVISQAVYEAVEGKLELNVVDLGDKLLKNIDHPVRLFALTGSRKRSPARNFLSVLVARRVPHILGAYLAASWAIVEVTEWLADHDIFDRQWIYTVIVGLLALVPTVVLVTYFHGAHGRERFTTLERVGIPTNFAMAAVLMFLVHGEVDIPAGLSPIEEASVAVLPFINLNDPDNSDYFSLGLSEELINALAKVPGLYVASRTSSFQYENHDEDPRKIARELRVATVLEGSVRRIDNTVRVTAQLIDGENNFHLWTDTFDREMADIFLIQEEIASSVALELVDILQPDVGQLFANQRAANLEAYDFYLQGLNYLRQPPNRESLENARSLLKQAIAEDGDYAQAFAALCKVELEQYVLDRSAIAIDVAERECQNALELDDDSREVRYALGDLYRHTGDYEKSETIFRKLLSEQVTPQATLGLGLTLDTHGDAESAETYIKNAIGLEPGNWHHRMALAEFYYWHCRYQESLAALQEVVRLSPDNVRAHLILGAAYVMNGDPKTAIQQTKKAIEISPSRGAFRDLGWTYYALGQYDEAVSAYQEALSLGPNDHATWGSLGNAYAQLPGQRDSAIEAYRRATDLADDLLAKNPRDWGTMARAAVYNIKIGALEKGLTLIENALTIRPDNADIHFLDAVIRTELKETEPALDALEKAIDIGCYPRWMIAEDPRFSVYKNNDRFLSLISD